MIYAKIFTGRGHVYRYAFLPVYIKMIYKSTIEFPFYK